MLYLQTLGRLELRGAQGARVRALQTRPKDLALLTYLAVARPYGFQRRDVLLALFWPDLDTARARNALSQGLHRLRAALGPGVLVIEGRDEVGVAAGRVACDLVSFDACLEAGDVRRAIRVYEGDFLAGFHASGVAPEFEEWVAGERERAQRRALNALLVLVDVEQKAGNEEAAIACLRQALDIRPCDETLCRRLIEALAAAGDRSGALAAYETFEQRLRDEYAMSPSAALRSVADAFREQTPSGESPETAARRPTDPRVLEASLKGRYFTSTMEHVDRGMEYLEVALELDPACAPALAAMAMALTSQALKGHMPPGEARPQASGRQRARWTDPALSAAHTAAARVATFFDRDWSRAEREFRLAVEIDPESSDAHAYRAQFLCAVGRADEGVAEAELAHRLDPLGPWASFTLGWALFRGRSLQRAVRSPPSAEAVSASVLRKRAQRVS